MKMAGVFSDNMVLQRGKPIPVWGWGDPGEPIDIRLAGQSAAATTGSDGRWRTDLPAMEAGGPYDMTVSGRVETVFRNVMVGDVWVCSGQSNMEWPLSLAADAEREVAAADHPGIRLLPVPKESTVDGKADASCRWEVCTPASAASFSAVGFYFGRELNRRLGIPIGLVNASWGGTRVEAWISRRGLMAKPWGRRIVKAYEKDLLHFEEAMRAYERRLAPKNKLDVGERLALVAMAKTYGEKIAAYSGPLCRQSAVEGARMRLRFMHAEGGLVAKGDALMGFSVAGDDRNFVEAKAAIDGDSVVVWNERVPHPVAVRYGWSANPKCNLFNGAGLPASPFRTDDWPGVTSPES
jgi:hypothetical protein